MRSLSAAGLVVAICATVAPAAAKSRVPCLSYVDGSLSRKGYERALGGSAAWVGDFNGDGRPDMVVTTSPTLGDLAPSVVPIRAFVVYGPVRRSIDLHHLGRGGVVVDGLPDVGNVRSPYGQSVSVEGAGDVNGDGLADVAIGPYVVFGTRSRRSVDVHSLGRRGLTVTSGGKAGSAAVNIGAAGDVNGDGVGDLVAAATVGAADAPQTAAVIFGSRSLPATVEIDQPATGGALLRSGDGIRAVAGAGDFDADGSADLAVAHGNAVDVVRGPLPGGSVDLDSPDQARSFRLATTDARRVYLSYAGDVNGNGGPDLLLSTVGSTENLQDRTENQAIYLGGTAQHVAVQLTSPFPAGGDQSTLVGLGDVNGEGKADVGLASAGRAYVVAGRSPWVSPLDPSHDGKSPVVTGVMAWLGVGTSAGLPGVPQPMIASATNRGRVFLIPSALLRRSSAETITPACAPTKPNKKGR